MTLEECAASIGAAVLYAPQIPGPAKPEPGVITSAGEVFAFVRYGDGLGSMATDPAHLTLRVPVTPVVTADLPGLPGVPESIGPLKCPECDRRAAAVYHSLDGQLSAVLKCGWCDSSWEMWMVSYSAGLGAGVLAEQAKRAVAQ
jgi:hypothetical protein